MSSRLKKTRRNTEAERTLEGHIVQPDALSFASRFFGTFFIDAVAAVFLATGFCMAGFYFSVFETGFLSNFFIASISAAALVLFATYRWTAPAMLLSASGGVVLYQYFSGNLAEWARYWLSFFRWAFLGGAYDSVFSENGSLLMLRIAIIFVITLATLVFMRKLFRFTLMLIIVTSIFAAIYIISRTDLSGAICVASIGVIVAMPRAYASYIERKGGKKSLNIRASMQLIAIPAAVISVVLSLFIVPMDTSTWRSKWLNDLIYDINSYFAGHSGTLPQGGSNFSLYNLGFQLSNERLGGPVSLKNTRLLTVTEASRPILLRGAVMDSYDGKNWTTTWMDGDYRYGRFFWRSYRNEAYGLNLPSGSAEAKRLFRSMCVDMRLGITYEVNSYAAIFAGGRVRDAKLEKRNDGLEPFFNMRSELYAHGNLSGRRAVSLRTTVLDMAAPEFDEKFLELERLLSGAVDDNYEYIYDRYTALSEELPETVAQTALEITSGEESPYLKAKAIQSWLGENFTYTLEPEIPPEDTDFIEHFLETREGYCSYYATAMAVLARCAGLPSRYITGLALEKSAENPDIYYATGKTAHAWTEIYFSGIGWVEFDPLEWDADAPLNFEAEPTPPPPPPPRTDKEDSTEPEISAEPQYPVNEYEPETPSMTPKSGVGVYFIWLAGLIAAPLVLRVLIAVVLGINFRRFEVNKVIRRSGSLDIALANYYADILRQLAFLEIEPRPGETLITFPARVDKRIETTGPCLADIAGPLMLMRFAEKSPSRTDIAAAGEYHSMLEARVIEKLGKTRYIIRRLIFNT